MQEAVFDWRTIDWFPDIDLQEYGICQDALLSLARCLLGNCACLLSSADFFLNQNSFRNTIRVSNSLDPEQARHFVEPVLGQTVYRGYQQTTLVGI